MPTGLFETQLFAQGHAAIAAVDEVGRGAWAGPLVAAGVVVEQSRWSELDAKLLRSVRDSKLLSRAQREILFPQILKFVSGWSVVKATVKRIDVVGVGQANHWALRQAASALTLKPSLVLIDGRPVKQFPFPSRAIIRGDREVFLIACASIIAKVTRDRLMTRYHKKFPRYGFARHVGYGTAAHQTALKKYGICSLHRRSFDPIKILYD